MLSGEERRRRNQLEQEKREKRKQYDRKYQEMMKSSAKGGTGDMFDIKYYIRTAKQLCYPQRALDELMKCKNDIQASNVMKAARNGMYDK